MKFKGHVLKTGGREYTLREQLSEGGFSVIYSTSTPEAVCKVQVLSSANIERAYHNEKYGWSYPGTLCRSSRTRTSSSC